MSREVRCIECARFMRSSTVPEVALGRCPSARLAWDGYAGQWPRKQHPCAAFVPLEPNRGEPSPEGPGGAERGAVKSPRQNAAGGRPEAPTTTPGAESAAPGHPQPPTAGAPRAIVFGRFAKAKDEMNVLASLAERDPYDYVLYLDKVLFMRMEAADRVRLIAHELSHALGKATADGDLKWGIRGHDYEMFAWEIKDLDWQKTSARWAEMAAALYDSDAPLPAELPPTPQGDYLAILENLRKQGVRITVTE